MTEFEVPEGAVLRLGMFGRVLDFETEPGRVYSFLEMEGGKWREAGGWGRKALRVDQLAAYVAQQDLL